ncbi:hypothetical protein NQD34_007536 [Periophthalmus magnuspinnatus]|nr:hypothetical protein NQD34_007536 [Periophthalmus magnuspinnatus]
MSACADAVCVMVLVCAVALPQAAVYTENQVSRSILDQVSDYEVTRPVWLRPQRHRRSSHASDEEKRRPLETQVVITAEGHELRLQLERNEQLLAPGYQEIWYSSNGTRMSSSRGKDEHCLYHGKVEGVEGSSVVVSTCSGLRGLISLNASVSYLVEPLPVYNDTQQHAVFRADSLHLQTGRCPHHHGDHEDPEGGLNNFIHGMMSPYNKREKRDLVQNMKYVELLLVADRAEFEKHGSSLEKTQLKLLEAANLVDKYYKALNIRVALIGLEVWTSQDLISVSDNPHSTLASFLSWRGKHLRSLPNDNAQLITGKSFQGTTIGLAPLKAMCSDFQSGGVNTDHSESAVGVAVTMAHEMGHNFGMSHDVPGCCQAKAEDGGCIMAAATGHPFPKVFNACNMKELKNYLNSGGGKCLFNLPNTRSMYGGQRCGTGYLEEGEECDCGEEEECTSPCCNANNCTLKAGAECAHGVCCDNCKLKSPGVLCRAASGSCDLPEYCDGKAESCPANFYLMDGAKCAGGGAYCYTGMCLTLEQQCRSLWGKDGRPAPDLCFKKVNEAGDMYGNCGKDLFGKYRKCTERDAKCGKIQCLSSATKPLETSAVRIETTVTIGTKKFLCMGTHVYKVTQGDEDPQGDTLDPGLVMTGTKCGEDSICFNGVCRNASFLRTAQCDAKCHGHGFCNNNHNCHCDRVGLLLCVTSRLRRERGQRPVPPNKNNLLLVLVILPLVLFVAVAAVGLWCCYKHKLRPLKTSAPPPVPSCSVPVEVKPSNDSSHVSGHANPTFLLKKQNMDQLGKSSPSASPSSASRSRHAFVRPEVKPPPVPAYETDTSSHSQTKETTQISVKSTQKKPPVPRPPPVPPPSLPPNPRPAPPSRPPPPCPVAPLNKSSIEQPKVTNVQITSDALQKKKAALAPSAGQKKPKRT